MNRRTIPPSCPSVGRHESAVASCFRNSFAPGPTLERVESPPQLRPRYSPPCDRYRRRNMPPSPSSNRLRPRQLRLFEPSTPSNERRFRFFRPSTPSNERQFRFFRPSTPSKNDASDVDGGGTTVREIEFDVDRDGKKVRKNDFDVRSRRSEGRGNGIAVLRGMEYPLNRHTGLCLRGLGAPTAGAASPYRLRRTPTSCASRRSEIKRSYRCASRRSPCWSPTRR